MIGEGSSRRAFTCAIKGLSDFAVCKIHKEEHSVNKLKSDLYLLNLADYFLTEFKKAIVDNENHLVENGHLWKTLDFHIRSLQD